MLDFSRTGYGRALFNNQIPEIARSLKAIAKELRLFNAIREQEIDDVPNPTGKFEKISDDETEALAITIIGFDEWFEQLMKNFDITKEAELGLIDVKKLCQHAWNANK